MTSFIESGAGNLATPSDIRWSEAESNFCKFRTVKLMAIRSSLISTSLTIRTGACPTWRERRKISKISSTAAGASPFIKCKRARIPNTWQDTNDFVQCVTFIPGPLV